MDEQTNNKTLFSVTASQVICWGAWSPLSGTLHIGAAPFLLLAHGLGQGKSSSLLHGSGHSNIFCWLPYPCQGP